MSSGSESDADTVSDMEIPAESEVFDDADWLDNKNKPAQQKSIFSVSGTLANIGTTTRVSKKGSDINRIPKKRGRKKGVITPAMKNSGRKKKVISDEEKVKVLALTAEGKTILEIYKDTGLTPYIIAGIIKSTIGCKKNAPGRKKEPLSNEKIQQIIELEKSGMGITNICASLGMHKYTVHKVLDEARKKVLERIPIPGKPSSESDKDDESACDDDPNDIIYSVVKGA